MCTNLQTKEGQRFIPDFLKDLDGTSVAVPGDPNYVGRQDHNRNPIARPLRADDVDEFAIERRREQLRQQYEENPGSIKPNPALTRRDVMEEIT